MNKPYVSIIIPVYNASKFIKSCLENCLSQSLDNIEIIVIDDKSTDNTRDLVIEVSQKDNRVKLIALNENRKQGYARNIGMEQAKSDYIMFLDVDDSYAPDCVEKMYKKITKDNADMTVCKFFLIEDGVDITMEKIDFCTNFATVPKLLQNGYCYKDFTDKIDLFNRRNVIWDKIYKKSFLVENDIKFPLGMFCEDDVFTFRAVFRAKKISILDERLVYYTVSRKNSSSNLKDRTKFDCFRLFHYLKEDLNKLGLTEIIDNEYMRFEVYSVLHFYDKVGLLYKYEFFKTMQKEFLQYKPYIDNPLNRRSDCRTYTIIDTVLNSNFIKFATIFFLRKIFKRPF
ncbi:MAG: glycosyltransferase family 2 protein [Candidatus Gastranaerophilaceae bacterium]